MKVPLFDLTHAVEAIREPLLERWNDILDRTAFVGGDDVARFEAAFAELTGAEGCVGVANGTDAITVSLRALGVGPGDEVIVPAFTFFATAETVAWCGATPRFADVDDVTLNIDPSEIDRLVSDRTRGVIGVHLFGQPFDVDAVRSRCERHGLWLIEDAAQAHGAQWQGRPVGALGDLASWSFYPSKNLGCFGDGGAVTGADLDRLALVRRIANHGRVDHYSHAEVGTNSRLDGLQAAILDLRLRRLVTDNDRRRAIAGQYRERLRGVGDVRFVEEIAGARSVYHQLTIRTARRDALRHELAERGIGSAIHYPTPLHRLEAMAPWVDASVSLPVAESASQTVLSLPMHPALTDEAVEYVSDCVVRFFQD